MIVLRLRAEIIVTIPDPPFGHPKDEDIALAIEQKLNAEEVWAVEVAMQPGGSKLSAMCLRFHVDDVARIRE